MCTDVKCVRTYRTDQGLNCAKPKRVTGTDHTLISMVQRLFPNMVNTTSNSKLPQRYLYVPNSLSSPEPTSISAPYSGAEMCKIPALTYKIKLRANSKRAEIVIVSLYSGLFHLSIKHNMHHRDGIGFPPGGNGLRGGEKQGPSTNSGRRFGLGKPACGICQNT